MEIKEARKAINYNENLKELTALNSFTSKDLPLSRQRKFQRIFVSAIAVNPNSDISVWEQYR